uniref:Uncharacterized protein n=1 Tax=Tanacetum cinerariifolium TaxID=118510 RepID=A0A6L2KE62_TANCI|nr:hypothetical protein [Tanacetum cinerariifolium]
MFTYCIENGILQDSSEPSNDNTNVVNALREPFVIKQDPGKNSSQSPPQINHHCCYGCGDLLEDIFSHQCTCELCGKGAHYGYNCPPKVSIVPNPEPFNNQTVDELPQTMPSFDPTCYSEDGNSFTYDSKSNLVHDSPNVFDPPPQPTLYSCEFCGNDARYGHYCTPQVPFIYPKLCYNQDLDFPQDFHDYQQQYLCCENCREEEKQIEEEQAAKTRYLKILACYDDDDDDYTIAITNKEPDNSLSTGDEHLNTAPATESDEFIKFSVENLVPNPNLHHLNAESDLIEYLLNHDSLIISSSKIDSLFDEFAGELTLLKSIISRINETDCDPKEETRFNKRLLYDNSSPHSPKEFISENSDTAFESFSPFPILAEDSDSLMEEIDLSFTPDDPMPSGIEEDDYDSERDILILDEFLSNDSFSLPKNESFHFDIPSSSRPLVKPPDGNTGILNVKVMGDISEHKVPMPRLMSTLVPNQEKSPNLLPHQGHEAFQPSTESPMMIYGKNTPILDVKDIKENEPKPDKIKSKREAWKSPESSPVKSKPSQNQKSIKLKKTQKRTKSDQTGQKREAWRSREKFKAATVDKERKTKENAKRMARNANTVKVHSKFKRKKEGIRAGSAIC